VDASQNTAELSIGDTVKIQQTSIKRQRTPPHLVGLSGTVVSLPRETNNPYITPNIKTHLYQIIVDTSSISKNIKNNDTTLKGDMELINTDIHEEGKNNNLHNIEQGVEVKPNIHYNSTENNNKIKILLPRSSLQKTCSSIWDLAKSKSAISALAGSHFLPPPILFPGGTFRDGRSNSVKSFAYDDEAYYDSDPSEVKPNKTQNSNGLQDISSNSGGNSSSSRSVSRKNSLNTSPPFNNKKRSRVVDAAAKNSFCLGDPKRSRGNDGTFDACYICNKHGNLLVCEHPDCPEGAHPRCVGFNNVSEVPDDNWFCDLHGDLDHMDKKMRMGFSESWENEFYRQLSNPKSTHEESEKQEVLSKTMYYVKLLHHLRSEMINLELDIPWKNVKYMWRSRAPRWRYDTEQASSTTSLGHLFQELIGYLLMDDMVSYQSKSSTFMRNLEQLTKNPPLHGGVESLKSMFNEVKGVITKFLKNKRVMNLKSWKETTHSCLLAVSSMEASLDKMGSMGTTGQRALSQVPVDALLGRNMSEDVQMLRIALDLEESRVKGKIKTIRKSLNIKSKKGSKKTSKMVKNNSSDSLKRSKNSSNSLNSEVNGVGNDGVVHEGPEEGDTISRSIANLMKEQFKCEPINNSDELT